MADFETLYAQMKASADDMSLAAVEQRQMMTAGDTTDVPITGYGNRPSYSKQLKTLAAGILSTPNSVLTFSSYAAMSVFVPTSANILAVDASTGSTYYWDGTRWLRTPWQTNAEIQKSKDLTGQLAQMVLTDAMLVSASGDYTVTADTIGVLRSAFLPPGGNTSAKLTLKLGSIVFFERDFFPGETLANGVLVTPFRAISLDALTVPSVTVETSVVRAALSPNVLNGVPSTTAYSAFDPNHDFTSIQAAQGSTTTLRGVSLHTSGAYLQVTIPKTELTAAGKGFTAADVQAYLRATFPGKIFYYQSSVNQTLYPESVFPIAAGTLTATAETGITFNFATLSAARFAQLDTLAKTALATSALAQESGKNGSYSRLVYDGPIEDLKASSQRFRKVVFDTMQTAPADDSTHSNRIMDIGFNIDGNRVARRTFPPRGAQLNRRSFYSYSTIYRISALKGVQLRYTDGVNTGDIRDSYFAGAQIVLVKYVRADNVNLPLASSTYKAVLDMKGVFSPESGGNAPLARTDIAVSMGGYNGNGCVQFIIPVSVLTAAGVSPSDAQAIYNYIEARARTSAFSYWDFTWTQYQSLDDVMNVLVPPGTLTLESLSTEGGVGGMIVKVYEEDAHTEADVAEFLRLTCDVKNSTSKDYLNYPVELKVSFPPGRVPSQDCLVLTDQNGNVYPCQFAGGMHPNPRFRSRLGRHPDGSLAAGSVYCMADIPAGQTLFFELRAYATSRNSYPAAPAMAIESQGRSSVTVDGYKLTFTLQNSVWALATITDPAGTVHNITFGSWICGTTFISGGYQETPFNRGSSLRLVNTGPVFSELESVCYSPPVDAIPEKAIRAVIRYRLFKNGKLQIKTIHSMEVGLPVAQLSGVITRMHFADAQYAYDNPSSTLYFTDPTSADDWGVSVVKVNGDQHRDGETYGPNRPIYLTALNPSGSSKRIYAGWKFLNQNANSFLNWAVTNGWTWTVEHWVDMKVGLTVPQDISSKAMNRPAGFLGESSYPSVLVRKALDEIETHLDGAMDWWYSGDAASVSGGPGNTRTFAYAPVTYDILRYLRDGIGSLETIYNRLVTVAKSFGVPDLNNIGTYYLSGNHLLQFASRITVPVLHWLYKVAVLKNNTAVRDNVKVAIKSFADAIVTYYNANGGVGLNGSGTGPGNSNANGTGIRIVALGIMSGQDSSGAYQATYNGIEALLTKRTGFMYCENILKEGQSDVLAAAWWIHYQVFAYNNYLLGCTAANKTPAFDMRNLIIQSASPIGGFDEIDYCISESRRGSFNTITFAAYPMALSKSASMMNALIESLKLFYSEYGPQPGLPKRYFGFDGYQAGSNVATTDIPFCATTFCDVWIDQYFRQHALDD